MMSKSSDISSQVGPPQGDNVAAPTLQAGPPEHLTSRSRNQVFKSGPLFISSKGIGWTSWKKRWFILTRTSLVFFRSDPSQAPQKVGEANLTLGGIDLNNSASVEVKADRRLLTVLFPDGRDGRAFTLKAETIEDLQEWKTALESALALAPSATINAGQNGVMKNKQADSFNGDADEEKDGPPGLSGKSMVLGRPILLALEDIDGSPSFLEKALRFIEDHGVRVEGILRQAADVDEVHHRVHEYEHGKTEFSPDEDAHIIGDCIKYVLRELPSSPVPASCCNALVEAFRTDRNNRVNAMRTEILETFPEPNRRLLQRILQMMQIVASNRNVNRMSTSAVAACMSPLLLRPLLAGECDLGDPNMDVAGDSASQLLQAAAAANHAQAIIITLLDEYNTIFGDGSGSASDGELFSDSDESQSGSEEASDDDMYEDDDDYLDDEDHEDASDDHEETDDDYEHSVTDSCSDSGDDHRESDSDDDKHSERSHSFSKSPDKVQSCLASQRSLSASPRSPESQYDHSVVGDLKRNNERLLCNTDSVKLHSGTPAETSMREAGPTPEAGRQMSKTVSQFRRRRWGRTSARKNLSTESIDFQLDEGDEIERLEAVKRELENQVEEEANGNSKLQASLERRKKALHERRLALEKDVTRLQEQLQMERDIRATMEAESGPDFARIPEKMKVELQKIELDEGRFINLKQRLDDVDNELHHENDEMESLLKDSTIELPDSISQGTTSVFNEMRDELYDRGTSKNERQQNYKIDGDDHDNDRKNQSSNKNQNHPSDVPRGGSSKIGWFSSTSSTEASITKPSPSNSKKSSIKGEGSSNTTSALSKLTNRLNFLKERRTQIANELQSIDKGRGSSTQPVLSPGKGKGTEPANNSDKSQGSCGSLSEKVEDHVHQQSHSFGNGSLTEADNNRDSDKKADGQSGNKKVSRKSEASSSQNEQHLDRVYSEGGQPSSLNSDAKTSRTLSR